jgi:hypothetical protein
MRITRNKMNRIYILTKMISLMMHKPNTNNRIRMIGTSVSKKLFWSN